MASVVIVEEHEVVALGLVWVLSVKVSTESQKHQDLKIEVEET